MTGKKNVTSNKPKKEELVPEVPSEHPPSNVETVETAVAVVAEQVAGAPKPKAKARGKAKADNVSKVEPKTKRKDVNVGQEESKKVNKKESKKKEKKEKKENKVGSENQEVNSDEELVNGRKLRSFKVKLPNSETFEGRFTGLTPYQAANKALSKYFRQNKESDAEVIFSINETTRSSKKTVYNYVGKRFKLEFPVTYEIKDAKDGAIRQIIKNYKNVLKKVKKVDTKES